MKMKFLAVMVAVALAATYLFTVGCGSDSPNYNTTGGGTSSTSPSVGSIQLTNSLTGAQLSSKAALKADQTYPVPANVTQFRYTGYDNADKIVYGPKTVDKATEVTLTEVPLGTTSLLYELLAGQQVVGSGRFKVVIEANQTYPVVYPPFDAYVVGTNALLKTAYTLSGMDTSSVGGTLKGTLQFDGNGNVVGGQILRNTTVYGLQTFNVKGGTYSVAGSADANRQFNASLTVEYAQTLRGAAPQFGVTMKGQVTYSPAGGAIYAAMWTPQSADYDTQISGFTTLQVQAAGFSNASLKGTYQIAGLKFKNNAGYSGSYFTGSVVFDGAGAVTGGTILLKDGTSLPVRNGTYTVAADTGKVTLGMNVGDQPARGSRMPYPFNYEGAVGADLVLSLQGLGPDAESFYLLGSPKPSTLKYVNVPSSMEIVGLRLLTGGVEGKGTFNVGNGLLTGGFYDEYNGTFVPVSVTRSTLPMGAFSVSSTADINGAGKDGDAVLTVVGGVFTQSEVVFFGALKKSTSDLDILMVLVK